MYYLKYRPNQLKEIDNVDRREILTKIFQSNNLPHAFLFVGPKGTGKTSTARIIAKILNCQVQGINGKDKQNVEPCNKCENCVAISKNRFLDVFELDAASNRGIDDIRALRDQVNYAPTGNKYKIYIIDEVHMLTKEAFNALLKTLEEPPLYVVFILATTEPKKLPDTIVSRCLTLNFPRATQEEIVNSLNRIIKGEELKVGPEVVKLIASFSQGSFRDAAKLLELAASSTDLSFDKVKQILTNNTSADSLVFLQSLLDKNSEKCLDLIQEYEKQDIDYSWLIEVLLMHLRTGFLVKKDLNQDKKYKQMFAKSSIKDISRLMKLLLEAFSLNKFSPIASLPLMIAVIEYSGQ